MKIPREPHTAKADAHPIAIAIHAAKRLDPSEYATRLLLVAPAAIPTTIALMVRHVPRVGFLVVATAVLRAWTTRNAPLPSLPALK